MQFGVGTRVSATQLNLTPGNIRATGRSLDIAINGIGFLRTLDLQGNSLYTRSGNLTLNSNGQVVMATAGHNIFERTSWSDIGQTMSLFGGGGHRGAGSCPLPPDDGDETLRRLVAELKRQG